MLAICRQPERFFVLLMPRVLKYALAFNFKRDQRSCCKPSDGSINHNYKPNMHNSSSTPLFVVPTLPKHAIGLTGMQGSLTSPVALSSSSLKVLGLCLKARCVERNSTYSRTGSSCGRKHSVHDLTRGGTHCFRESRPCLTISPEFHYASFHFVS